jgi:hypothetical protein
MVKSFQERFSTMSDDDLEAERGFAGHYYGTGRSPEDEEENNYYGIQYDCACIELNNRGLYEFGHFDNDIFDRIKGEYDYHNAIVK